ncbi:hypothetical protein CWI75_04530 [Kineobactrum sediminis]|uniref:HTH tetR-type domain-containing protein n=1 Tax=Kineobactrum sediminis TaxID=1905677 RepID=A0A2N5Y5H7_9GAMM|nr:TetR/AcrR family transcriptional regulator [Kineobactrum sediminis]PLW83621.1 hypothetical protein CWI75_04530 [Kineobactrum sediminis]
MASKSIEKRAGTGLRRGTAQRRAGKETAARIVQAAQEVLSEKGHTRFSMRNVAEQAGVSLANVQYYFPRQEDLVKAIFDDLGSRYRSAYTECLKAAGPSAQERFEAVLRFNLGDITDARTKRFFLQLWALLSNFEEACGELLEQLYAVDIEQLNEHISALDPTADAREITTRSTLLAAMIEGLMVVLGNRSPDSPETRALLERAHQQGLAIARGVS